MPLIPATHLVHRICPPLTRPSYIAFTIQAGLASSSSAFLSIGSSSRLLTSPLSVLDRLNYLAFQQMITSHTKQIHVAAAVCLFQLVVSEKAAASETAGCDVFQMMLCVAASKYGGVRPSSQCCSIVRNMGTWASEEPHVCVLL